MNGMCWSSVPKRGYISHVVLIHFQGGVCQFGGWTQGSKHGAGELRQPLNDRLPIMEAQHSNYHTYIFVLSHVYWILGKNYNNFRYVSQRNEKSPNINQAKNITLPVFATTTIFGMFVVSWQLSYCVFCIKRVYLKPFGKLCNWANETRRQT